MPSRPTSSRKRTASDRPAVVRRSPPARSGGMTMIELLVVITVLLMLTIASIPMLAPALKARRVREAARQISTYLAGAKARAMEIGRPVGVVFEPLGGLPTAVSIYYVETPPPYSGDWAESRAFIQGNKVIDLGPVAPPDGQRIMNPDGTPVRDDIEPLHVRRGEKLRLNYSGRTYLIEARRSGDQHGHVEPPWVDNWDLRDAATGRPPIPPIPDSRSTRPGTPPVGLPYEIIRGPVKGTGAPAQLPPGAVVNFRASGEGLGVVGPGEGMFFTWDVGPDGFPGAPGDDDENGAPDDLLELGWEGSDDSAQPLTIMFSPSGAVEQVIDVDYPDPSIKNDGARRPMSPLFFHVSLTEDSLAGLVAEGSGQQFKSETAGLLEAGDIIAILDYQYPVNSRAYHVESVDADRSTFTTREPSPATFSAANQGRWFKLGANSHFVAIHPASGLVTVAALASVPKYDAQYPYAGSFDPFLRRFAREGQGEGGR